MHPDHSPTRFVSILSDYGFKATFGNQSDTRFLRKALQALILTDTPIQQITFIQNEMQGLTKESRSGVYDVFCTDEAGNNFIVEMQLGTYPDFIQRMKFYALYRLNTLVRKGNYRFNGLPKLYCIGILGSSLLPQLADCHNVGTLKNSRGELMDDQLTFITVELTKFNKTLTDVESDLDKLLYTMKTVDTVTEPTQYPTFWTEEWLETAIRELDTRAMTPEERMIYEITIANNALAVHNENDRIQAIKIETVQKALKGGKLTVDEIADYTGVTPDFVRTIQQEMARA